MFVGPCGREKVLCVTRRRWLALAGLVLVGALAFLSADRCGVWPVTDPMVTSVAFGRGELRVGAAQQAAVLPGAVTIGGYGPVRRSTSSGDAVFARATVLEVGGTRFGVVSLEVLLLTQPLVAAIREGADFPVLVTATHTHSSVGQFDRRLASQLAALGAFDAAAEQALVTAARGAVEQARQALAPAAMEVRSFDTTGLVRARSGDQVDTRGLEVRFAGADRTLGRWLLLAAHPTLAPRRTEQLDTDWPGLVSSSSEGVTLVLQTSVGNASVGAPRDEREFSEGVWRLVDGGVAMSGCERAPSLALATGRVTLPHPDGSRLVPWPVRGVVENGLCAANEMDVEVAMLRLGCLALLALPVEPTAASSTALERMTGATRVLALSGGYVGYLEPADEVRRGVGEARRQWFGPELFDQLSRAGLQVSAEATLPGAAR